jgi:membrane protease YdiL (CAAX protease family)
LELIYLPFILLGIAFLSTWARRDPKVWGGLAALSVIAAQSLGYVSMVGTIFLIGWAVLWFVFAKLENKSARIAMFWVLLFVSFGFKFHLFAGFKPLQLTPRFFIGMDSPWIGLFPLALLVPLASNLNEMKVALTKGLWLTLIGIFALILLATINKAANFEPHWPSYPITRYLTNLILVAIPEEAFYRGFVQNQFVKWLPNTLWGKSGALIIASLIFMLAHLFWSPNPMVLGFTFLAGLLYGGVYMVSGRIESAILCHFLFNFVHMTFFSYHAM